MGGQARLPRAQRREQILHAATATFARLGYASTSLDDVAQEAGITRVLLYRHFDSKSDLYRAALSRFCAVLGSHIEEPRGGFTDASLNGLVAAAAADPDGYRLLFVQSAREPEFSAQYLQFRAQITAIAEPQVAAIVHEDKWAAWAAALAPTIAIEAISAWLDAGQPDRALAADRIRHAVTGAILAASAETPSAPLPAITPLEGT